MLIKIIFLFQIVSYVSANQDLKSDCDELCNLNINYWGKPWGEVKPVYLFPGLPYHSFFGPTPFYFEAFPPSPYLPAETTEHL